ncbi:hypothetical protein [Sporosarcina jiandibaonis]|uniref:hypothetical protein n=1 Tax=Sporosarcina jiandibaonis TaxID=2715535 RepID=UPI001552FCCC|nr:hypothetical protein [Sporosarcina jiandibaonis]
MGSPFEKPLKTMIMGYLLPLLAAAMVAFIPAYDHLFTMWIIAVFVILLLMPIVLVIRFPDNKEKAYRLTIMYQLYAFTFYMTFPLLKVLREEIVYQLLLVGFFIAIFFLARFDQRTEVPIVYPGDDKEIKWMAYVYYAIVILLTFLGFGGDYITTRRYFDRFGDAIMMPYVSTIMYLFSCWLIFLFSSLAYKSHVKEGYLEK